MKGLAVLFAALGLIGLAAESCGAGSSTGVSATCSAKAHAQTLIDTGGSRDDWTANGREWDRAGNGLLAGDVDSVLAEWGGPSGEAVSRFGADVANVTGC